MGPTRAGKSWVHFVKPLRYLLWKGVVSVWPEGTLGRTSPFRIRQMYPIFFTGHSDHAGHARKKLSRFETVWIFYGFPGRKPLKYCPDMTQLAFVLGFRSFWPWGARVGPHMRWQKLGAFRETAQVLAVEGLVSVWPEGTLGRTSPLRIRQTCPICFRGPQRPCRARTQKIVAFRLRMDFLQFSGPKTPKIILPGRDAKCVRCRISFILAVGCPGWAPHALAKVGCLP